MKFYAEPNLHIIRQRLVGNRTEGYELCVFDENGEVETEDKEVIRQLKNIYRHDEEPQTEPENKLPADGLYNCKKCNFSTTNKGELMQHYKHSHPKEG